MLLVNSQQIGRKKNSQHNKKFTTNWYEFSLLTCLKHSIHIIPRYWLPNWELMDFQIRQVYEIIFLRKKVQGKNRSKNNQWVVRNNKGCPLRDVYCKKSVSYEESLLWADLHTLRNRRLQEMATVMYKVKNNLSPSYIADLFKLNNSGYHLRNSDFIIRPFNSVS